MTGVPREVPVTTYTPGTDDHDSSATLTYRGVSVTVTFRSLEFAQAIGKRADTVIVQVDTDPERTIPLSVNVNDYNAFEEEVS